MSRAVWRARSGDPQTPWGWFLRDESLRRLPLLFAFLAAAAVGAATVAGWSVWALALLPLVALHARYRPRPLSDLDPLVTEPAPGPSFRCRVQVNQDKNIALPNTMLGEDDGVVTFVDGWLYFAGERTEFSFRPVDVEARGLGVLAQRLALRDGGSVAFTDLEGTGATARAPGLSEMGRAFNAWYGSRLFPAGEPVLPPSRVHPSGLARAWRGVVGTVTLGYLAMFAIDAFFHHSGAIGTAFFVVGLPTGYGRLKTLRKLAREERRALSNERRGAIGP